MRVLGWTREMPELMAGADCLIQNAGGMTCAEAEHMRLPILLFNPIPGHGRMNSAVMERAGAAVLLRTPERLEALLSAAVRREISLQPPATCGEPGVVPALEALLSSGGAPAARPYPSTGEPTVPRGALSGRAATGSGARPYREGA